MSNTNKDARYISVNKTGISVLMEFIVKWGVSAIYKHDMEKNRARKENREYRGQGEGLIF